MEISWFLNRIFRSKPSSYWGTMTMETQKKLAFGTRWTDASRWMLGVQPPTSEWFPPPQCPTTPATVTVKLGSSWKWLKVMIQNPNHQTIKLKVHSQQIWESLHGKSWCLWPAMPWQAHLGPAPLLSFRRWVAPASALKNMLQTIIVCFSGSGVNISGLRVCVFNFLGVSFKESAWKPEFRKFLQIAAHRTKAYAPTHARVWGLNKWSCPV